MFTIRKATTADCALIQKLAQQIFPVTYKDILTPEQTDYMMEWMYSLDNIRKQMEEEGHVYFLAYEECEPRAMCPYSSKEKIYSTCKRFMYSPITRVHIAAVSSFAKPSSTSRKCIPALV